MSVAETSPSRPPSDDDDFNGLLSFWKSFAQARKAHLESIPSHGSPAADKILAAESALSRMPSAHSIPAIAALRKLQKDLRSAEDRESHLLYAMENMQNELKKMRFDMSDPSSSPKAASSPGAVASPPEDVETTAEKRKMWAQLDELRGQLSDVQTNLDDKTQKLRMANEEKSRLTRLAAQAKSEKEEIATSLEIASSELKVVKAALEGANGNLQVLKDENSKTTDALNAATAKAARLATEIEDVKEERARVQLALAKVTEAFEKSENEKTLMVDVLRTFNLVDRHEYRVLGVDSEPSMDDSRRRATTRGHVTRGSGALDATSRNGSEPALIIDIGAHSCKVGLSIDAKPLHVKPYIAGGSQFDDLELNDNGTLNPGTVVRDLEGEPPVKNGLITDWDEYEKLYGFLVSNELNISSTDYTVILPDVGWNSAENREKLAELYFETFDVPALCMVPSAMLSLLATGRTTGVVLEIGDTKHYAQPIFENVVLNHTMVRGAYSGNHLTKYLKHMMGINPTEKMGKSDYFLTKDAIDLMATMIKDSKSEVVTDYRDPSFIRSFKFKLPDGKCVELGKELLSVGEALFRPELMFMGDEYRGAHEVVFDSIASCAIDLKRSLYANIVVAGGTCSIPGFAERLADEVASLAPASMSIDVAAPPECGELAWYGGQLLATLPIFSDMCMTADDYAEYGAAFINNKFETGE